MTGSASDLRLAPREPRRAAGSRRAPRFDALALVLLLVGLVPIAGFAVFGEWRTGELGVGTILVCFALLQLASSRDSRRGRRRSRGGI